MKRALNKKVKTVLETTPSDHVPQVAQLSVVNPPIKHRVPKKAAMIGLAISVGATSFLVTRQSDQALAAEPIGSQNTTTVFPVPHNVIIAPTQNLDSQAAKTASVPSNPVIVAQATNSHLGGLGKAKWQSGDNQTSVKLRAALKAKRSNTTANYFQVPSQSAKVPRISTAPDDVAEVNNSRDARLSVVKPDNVNPQLKAQQKFALNRLKEKSNRLQASLAQWRSEQIPIQTTIATKSTTTSAVRNTNTPVWQQAQSQPNLQVAAPVVISPLRISTYKVKSGDTLAVIAKNNNTSVSELVKVNRLSNPNDLQLSQQLMVPMADKAVELTTVGFNTGNSTSTQAVASEVDESNSAVPTTAIGTSNLGMGGDTPVPQVIAQTPGKQIRIAQPSSKNEGLRSLKEEIENLREKYRVQESGDKVITTQSQRDPLPIAVPTPNTAVVPPVPKSFESNSAAVPSVPNSQPNREAVKISVPQPASPSYSSQPNSTLPTKLATPSVKVNPPTGTLGEGTTSKELPPLAAVDRYLPQPIEELSPTSTGYMWPAKGVLTSGFGRRWGRMHKGIDIAAPTGTPIHAAAAGVVASAGWNRGGYGNLVEVRHADGTVTRYAHNSKLLVTKGQEIQQGQKISLMGSTGFSTGPHLHFEIRPSGKDAVNPIAMLPEKR